MLTTDRYWIEVSEQPMDFQRLLSFCASDSTGALTTFTGTVRNHFKGRPVKAVEYSAYQSMAEQTLGSIVESVFAKWDVERVVVCHRFGLLQVREASVFIAVASAHRAAAFEACRFIIEEIKRDVPIWKKDYFSDGDAKWQALPGNV